MRMGCVQESPRRFRFAPSPRSFFLSLVSTTSLRYFAEVVRTGSIRAASENLYVAASAISRQLAMLEDSLGAPLLERRQGRGKVKLTAAGERPVYSASSRIVVRRPGRLGTPRAYSP